MSMNARKTKHRQTDADGDKLDSWLRTKTVREHGTVCIRGFPFLVTGFVKSRNRHFSVCVEV